MTLTQYYALDALLYGLLILSFVLALYAQLKVSSTFRRFSRTPTAAGMSVAHVARMILDSRGLRHVRIERVRGHLSDHYDPRSQVLRLSDGVYDNPTAAAIGVAAHEAGHAIQYAEGYFPVKLRTRLVPVTSFASGASWIFILLGLLLGTLGQVFLLIGIVLFSVTTLFQLVTLPCEFDASRRAMTVLSGSGYFTRDELRASRKVLSAAALTYVAALLTSMLQLLRLLLIFGSRDRQ